MADRDRAVVVALIGAGAVIIAALVAIVPSFRSSGKDRQQNLVIAGTVVDGRSNSAIGQAHIQLTGREETYVTEDNGSFRMPMACCSLPASTHLFDRGFIGFENSGQLIISPLPIRPSLQRMGIETEHLVNVGSFSEGQKHFLEFHRNSVLLRASR